MGGLAPPKRARAKSARGASSVVLARELTNEVTQGRLIDLLGSLRRGKPLDLTLLLFRPFSALALHVQRKNADLAFDGPAVPRPNTFPPGVASQASVAVPPPSTPSSRTVDCESNPVMADLAHLPP